MPDSGDVKSLMCWANAENSSSRVLGSHSSSGVLRTAQAMRLSWGYASGVKGLDAILELLEGADSLGRHQRQIEGRLAVE